MSKLTVVFDDKVIIKGDESIHFAWDSTSESNFDAVVTAQGDSGLHAIQWDGSTGQCEYKDGSLSSTPTADQISAYSTAFDTEKERLKQKEKADFLSLNATDWARAERNMRLGQTDTYALSDRVMSAEMTAYRQALRDLPTHPTDWNPALSWDDATWTGSLTGVTWPTQP